MNPYNGLVQLHLFPGQQRRYRRSASMDARPIPDYWRIPDDLWDAIHALLPEHKNTHRFGGGRPRTTRSRLHGRHLLRAAHRLPMEGFGRHQVLPRLHGP